MDLFALCTDAYFVTESMRLFLVAVEDFHLAGDISRLEATGNAAQRKVHLIFLELAFVEPSFHLHIIT